MNASDVGRSAIQRFRSPAGWGVVLGFALAWVPVRLLAGLPFERMGSWEFFVPALFAAGHVLLAAAPWQWTGDRFPRAQVWRGLLQALLWNTAWVLLLLWAVQDHVRPARPAEDRKPPAAVQGADPAPPREEDDRPPRPRRGGDDPPPREEQDRPPRPEPARDDRRKPAPGTRPELMLLVLNLPFALVLGWFLAEKERAELKELDSLARERQARARALQSQLHPHVLYNVLGGITELVHEDPDAAEEALVGLTELLRMLMQHGSALALPLGQERALLRRYLEIEAIRLGPRLEVQWTWQEALDSIQLPPLLLQPLVENAVKHGIASSPAGGVLRVEAIRTGTGLLLRVANTGLPLQPGAKEGTGLGNLRERLALLPEPRPVLDLRQEGPWTVAELRIDGTFGP